MNELYRASLNALVWMEKTKDGDIAVARALRKALSNYAAPVRTKDLTDDEIAEIVTELDSKLIMRDATELEIARAVIAKYKEKNK